jgi:hypothetical protein
MVGVSRAGLTAGGSLVGVARGTTSDNRAQANKLLEKTRRKINIDLGIVFELQYHSDVHQHGFVPIASL